MRDMTMGREARALRMAARGAAEEASASAMRAGGSADSAMNAGLAWWDLMLQMQRASFAAFSVYSPGSDTRISGSLPQGGHQAATQVIPVGEERLNIATRTELGQTTRIRRRVVAQPVEQEVTLREERVVLERRPAPPAARRADPTDAAAAPRGEVLTETVIEMSDSRQVPQVWKSIHVAEEVVLRREVTERKERVRETLRRDVVEVEHDRDPRALEAENISARRAEAEREAARERTEALAEAAREAITPAGAAEPRRAEGADAAAQDRKPAGPGNTPPTVPPRKA